MKKCVSCLISYHVRIRWHSLTEFTEWVMKHLLFSECCRFLNCRKGCMDLYFLSIHCLIGTPNLTCSQMWLLILTPYPLLQLADFLFLPVSVNSILSCLKPSVWGVTFCFPPFLSPRFPYLRNHRSVGLFCKPDLQSYLQGPCYLPLSANWFTSYKMIRGIFKNRKQLVPVSCLLHWKIEHY